MKSVYKNKNPENPTFSFFSFSMYFKEYTTMPRSVIQPVNIPHM